MIIEENKIKHTILRPVLPCSNPFQADVGIAGHQHTSCPQLKTWINKLIFPICTFVKLAEKMLVDKSFL